LDDNGSHQDFYISIVSQHWLGEEETEYDLCSHGLIHLVIGGDVISSSEIEYGISESALALLRTLEKDHSAESPVAERLVFHGCGTLLMMGCPIGINWSVTHVDDGVLISRVDRHDTTSDEPTIRFSHIEVTVPEEQYRQQVLSFAQEVKSWFQRNPRTFYDDFDRQQFKVFWVEFDRLLHRYTEDDCGAADGWSSFPPMALTA